MNLLENVYLPDFKKRQIRDSEAYKLLEKEGMDTSPLEGNYEEKGINLKIKDFDSYINEGGTKEDWVALHADKETQKEFWIDTSSKDLRMKMQENVESQLKNFMTKAKKNGVDMINIYTDQDFVEPLLKFFKMRENRI